MAKLIEEGVMFKTATMMSYEVANYANQYGLDSAPRTKKVMDGRNIMYNKTLVTEAFNNNELKALIENFVLRVYGYEHLEVWGTPNVIGRAMCVRFELKLMIGDTRATNVFKLKYPEKYRLLKSYFPEW